MLEVILPIASIMVGCCSNVISLEVIMKSDSASGDLITFCQFVFVALEGLFFHVESSRKPLIVPNPQKKLTPSTPSPQKQSSPQKQHVQPTKSILPFRLKPRDVPIPYYMVMVLIFFLVSVLNNKALAYKISLPFHMIFRSGSLLANMLMGVVVFRKQYSFSQFFSVILLTLGVFMATSASASQIKQQNQYEAEIDITTWLIGVSMLLAALLFSSVLGLYQEYVYKIFGKNHYRESMFYSHLLALPFFALFYNDIITHYHIYNASQPYTIPFVNVTIPILWWYMLINVLTQYVCIRGVFTLGGMTGSSLTSTLVITLRKFVSLVISVVYFGNPFSTTHWISTTLVFAGTLMYTFAPSHATKVKKA